MLVPVRVVLRNYGPRRRPCWRRTWRGLPTTELYSFPPEMRREIYEALRLKVTVAKGGTPRMQGVADAQVIRLTRAVEDYGNEVEQYREKLRVGGELSSSKGTVTVMAEVAG
jgi:hypothetical protein